MNQRAVESFNKIMTGIQSETGIAANIERLEEFYDSTSITIRIILGKPGSNEDEPR